MSGERRRGSWIETPSEPSTLTSIDTFSSTAPGAKFNIQSAVAWEPLIALAPVAFSKTQPVSSEPSFGQIVLLPVSCALTSGDDRIGPKDANNITVTSSRARAPALAGPTALLRLFMYPIRLQWYINRMLSCFWH